MRMQQKAAPVTGLCLAFVCLAAGTCGAAEERRVDVSVGTPLFSEDFETGRLDGWQTRGGRIEIVRDGSNNRVCSIASEQGSVWLTRLLPGDELIGRRLTKPSCGVQAQGILLFLGTLTLPPSRVRLTTVDRKIA